MKRILLATAVVFCASHAWAAPKAECTTVAQIEKLVPEANGLKQLSPEDFATFQAAAANFPKDATALYAKVLERKDGEPAILAVAFNGKGCMLGYMFISMEKWADIFGGDGASHKKTEGSPLPSGGDFPGYNPQRDSI